MQTSNESKLQKAASQKILRWSHRLFVTTNLTLLAAIVLLWPLSYFRAPHFYWETPYRWGDIEITGGRLMVTCSDHPRQVRVYKYEFTMQYYYANLGLNEWSYTDWNSNETPTGFMTSRLGVTSIPNFYGPFEYAITLAIPFSYLTLLLLIYPALTYRHYKKTRHLHPTRAFPLDPPILPPLHD